MGYQSYKVEGEEGSIVVFGYTLNDNPVLGYREIGCPTATFRWSIDHLPSGYRIKLVDTRMNASQVCRFIEEKCGRQSLISSDVKDIQTVLIREGLAAWLYHVKQGVDLPEYESWLMEQDDIDAIFDFDPEAKELPGMAGSG